MAPKANSANGDGSGNPSNIPSDSHHEDEDAYLDPNEVAGEEDEDESGDVPMDEDDDEDEDGEEGMGRFRVVGDDGEEFMGDEVEEAPEDNSLGHSAHHDSSVFSLALHPSFPNPPLAVSGGEDDLAYIFSPMPDQSASFPAIKLTGHTDSVIAASFSADGELVASGGMDGKVRVWRRVKGKATAKGTPPSAGDQNAGLRGLEEWKDWKDWEFLTSLDTGDEITWIAWHPKGPVLAAGCNDSTVWMWQLPSGNTMMVFSSHTETTTAGQFSPNGKLLITASSDSTLCVYDPREANPLLKLAPGQLPNYPAFEGGLTCMAVAPASNLVAIGGADGSVRIVNLPAGNVVGVLAGHAVGESVEGLKFLDVLGLASAQEGTGTKGLVLVSCGTDAKATVWDVTTGNPRAEIRHEDVITSIAPHPAPHQYLFTTGSADRTLKTWDARNGSLIAEHKGHVGLINDVKVGRIEGGGEAVISAGDDGAVLVWNV